MEEQQISDGVYYFKQTTPQGYDDYYHKVIGKKGTVVLIR